MKIKSYARKYKVSVFKENSKFLELIPFTVYNNIL